jgi:hypothetical protein
LEKDTSTLESVGNMAAFFLWGIFNCRGIGIGITFELLRLNLYRNHPLSPKSPLRRD